MTAGLRIARVDLRVADAARSHDFYAEITGHDELPLAFLDAGVRPEPAPRRAAGLFHTALRFTTREALGAALRRVSGRLTGASDHGFSEALYLDDADGNGVELYWDRPREVWPPAVMTEPLDLPDLMAAAGDQAPLDVGHVHLKSSDIAVSTEFWKATMGLESTASLLDQAEFLSADGYHHHIGLNVWHSRGAPVTPSDLPGIDRIVFEAREGPFGEHRAPEGPAVEVHPAGPAG